MYRLVFSAGPGAATPVTGDATALVIGRAEGCGLRLAAEGVRDKHAVIERRPDGYYIRDLANSHSVRVNATAVTQCRLAAGDAVEIGTAQFKFEVWHDSPDGRRVRDWWQVTAVGAIGLLLTGQLATVGWIFSQDHPRTAKLDIVKGKAGKTAPAIPAASQAPTLGTEPVNAPLVPLQPAPPVAAPTMPAVLSRMVKLTRVDRVDHADHVLVRATTKAQVRERELDAAAVTVGVQFFTAPTTPLPVVWIKAPAPWENFSSKQLTARFDGQPAQCAGYVVRTFYRNELQDVYAMPAELAAWSTGGR